VAAARDAARLLHFLLHIFRVTPGRVIGAKLAAECLWNFQLLGAGPADTLDDLFPGYGAVTRAWAAYSCQPDPLLADVHDASGDPDLCASFQARADASSRPQATALLVV